MDFLKMANSLKEDMIKWRRHLHQIPELGNNLPKTVEYVTSVLDEIGVEYIKLVDGNAIVATVGKGNKCVALRGDMDGLPITEETGLDFASTNGCMHACGHDGHTSMLLACVKALKSVENELGGVVKFFFQPGEESPGGAKPMIEEGCMENPKVDAVFGLHEGMILPLEKGQIGVRAGYLMAASDRITIKVIGRGTHGAKPDRGVDPMIIASHIVLSLQHLVSREIPGYESAVVTIGKIEGGSAFNIIPNQVNMYGTVRTFNPKVKEHIKSRMPELCGGIAKAYRGDCEVIYEEGYPTTVNDKEMTEFLKQSAAKVMPEAEIIDLENPTLGGEDMSYFLQAAKGSYFFLTNPRAIDGDIYAHHHPKFDVDEDYFTRGSSILMQVAYDFLNE